MSVSKLAPKGNLITTLTNTQSLAIRRPATYLSSQHRQFSNTLTPLSEPSSKQPIGDSLTSASANFPSQTTSNHFTSRRQAQEDPDHIDRQTTELTKSSTDNAAAETDVAFDSSTRPEHARDTTGQVLEVSAANPEVSKHAAEQPPGGPTVKKGEDSRTLQGPGSKHKQRTREDPSKKDFKGFDRRKKDEKEAARIFPPGMR